MSYEKAPVLSVPEKTLKILKVMYIIALSAISEAQAAGVERIDKIDGLSIAEGAKLMQNLAESDEKEHGAFLLCFGGGCKWKSYAYGFNSAWTVSFKLGLDEIFKQNFDEYKKMGNTAPRFGFFDVHTHPAAKDRKYKIQTLSEIDLDGLIRRVEKLKKEGIGSQVVTARIAFDATGVWVAYPDRINSREISQAYRKMQEKGYSLEWSFMKKSILSSLAIQDGRVPSIDEWKDVFESLKASFLIYGFDRSDGDYVIRLRYIPKSKLTEEFPKLIQKIMDVKTRR